MPPIIKYNILKFLKFNISIGDSKVVGPIIIGYTDPNINPNTRYIVLDLWCSKHFLNVLANITTPNIIPRPNIINTGKALKSRWIKSFILFIIGIYSPNIRRIVEPDIPGKIIADMARAPDRKI